MPAKMGQIKKETSFQKSWKKFKKRYQKGNTEVFQMCSKGVFTLTITKTEVISKNLIASFYY